MTPEELQEEEKYFNTFRDLFSSEGWRLLMEETLANVEYLDSVEGCKSHEDLWYRKGQIATLANMLNLEEMLKRSEENFLADSVVH
jgi:hypothetical protein